MTGNENQGAAVERIITRDTPTDDEREAMRRIIAQGSYSRSPEDLPYADVADRLAAAGFRRSEAPEPSADDYPDAEGLATLRSATEPQGEPSGAWEAVEALNRALTFEGTGARREKALHDAAILARRALIGAAVTEQGENR